MAGTGYLPLMKIGGKCPDAGMIICIAEALKGLPGDLADVIAER